MPFLASLLPALHAIGAARAATQREPVTTARVRRIEIDDVREDHRVGASPERMDTVAIEEEVVPLGQDVCAIGTSHQRDRCLTARRSRVGPNLMVYQGPPHEVL